MLHGLSRGSFSFVALLVINPIVILFYQNCSMAPLGENRDHYTQQSRIATPLRDQYLGRTPASSVEARNPSSNTESVAVDPQAHSKQECLPSQASCSHGVE